MDLTRKTASADQALDPVIGQLRERCSIDFSQYKENTLRRRIERRMALRGMSNLAAYAGVLDTEPGETEALCQDLMINVTAFFRDPECFEALRTAVFPGLLATSSEESLRIWVVGCATGEEAYSIAITLLEYMREADVHRPLRIFGTDINAEAIASARRAWFADEAVSMIEPQLRERYFLKLEHGYAVRKIARELCTFAQHNALAEPPFHRMDLVSCRNVLIYFQRALQQKLLPLLHFALKPRGFLFIGAAESISHYRDLFASQDLRHKIYVARPPVRKHVSAVAHAFLGGPARDSAHPPAVRAPALDMQRLADLTALKAYAPPGVLVDEEGHILHYRGDVTPYLAQADGRPTHSLFKVVREGLLRPLRTALSETAARNVGVRREGVVVKNGEGLVTLSLHVLPVTFPAPHPPSYWVFFEATEQSRAHRALLQSQRLDSPHDISHQLEVLTDELTATQRHLEATIEAQIALNEDLQVANEEIQSTNEELQSSNEELEVSKEEIQSSNEELLVVNDELRHSNGELDQANDDLVNLFDGIDMAIVTVWSDLRIRRFTPLAQPLFNLLPADVGRSLADIQSQIEIEDLPQLLLQCVKEVCEIERQVKSRDGRYFSLRIRPYRTQQGEVQGAMMMLIDIDTLARTQQSLGERVIQLAAVDRHKNEFLAILAHELRNPLAPLRNAVQILKHASPADDAPAARAREMIDRQVQHMSRLVSDLLDAARAQHGRIRLQRVPLDLRVPVENVIEQLRPAFEAKSQLIEVRLPVVPLWIDGDAARLEQIFMNLLNNASKFTQPGGEVEIRLEAVGDPATGVAMVHVRDNGVGLEVDSLKNLFQLFSQADRSLAHSEGGLGIGLSLVRTIVDLHGGQVSADSAGLGRGSAFHLQLPLCAAPVTAIANSESVVSAHAQNNPSCRVLVVEDNQDIRESSCELLSLSGFEVLGAASGTEALEVAPGFAPKAILLDVGLPDMSGYELARQLRTDGRFAATALIALTGYDSPEARRLSAEAGCNHHLVKPVNFEDLTRLLT